MRIDLVIDDTYIYSGGYYVVYLDDFSPEPEEGQEVTLMFSETGELGTFFVKLLEPGSRFCKLYPYTVEPGE